MFDGTCDLCLNQSEMLCRNGGIIGVVTNGGFAEYISVPERNVFKMPDEMDWDLAASHKYFNSFSCLEGSLAKSK